LLLRNAFKNDLPESIFSRSKKGFEVPIERWLKGELLTLLKVSTEEKLIEEQQLFNLNTIQELINKLNTKNVGDSSATLWSIIVFQVWWKQHFSPALK
jgi:asparagine synthase (glutamine-hydrolysing)